MSQGERAYDVALVDALRPRTRGDCIAGPRPCPWVGCRMHLAGARIVHDELVTSWPIDESDPMPGLCAMPETCALDVADVGAQTLEDVGELLRLTRERVRQLEAGALHRAASVRRLRLYFDQVER